MQVIFLCGGVGKRMFPITEDKFLLRFLGKTLLEHQVEMAVAAGLREFVIVASPASAQRVEQIAAGFSGVKVELAVQKEPLGMANAIDSASRFFKGEVIIINPNDVFESSAYTALLAACRDSPADSYILGYKVKDYFPGGYLVVDKQSYLKRIVEKPEKGKEPSELVNIVVHLHRNPERLLEYIRKVKTDKDDAYELALGNMAQDRWKIRVIPYSGFWQPIKYPWHILGAVKYFLDRSQPYSSSSARVSPKAVIEGKVILCDNVRIMENAVIRGPAYIGADSVIGNNVLIRDYSHIGAGCVVGNGTEVKRGYIGSGCWFHSNYIGDSIIGDGCTFGAGAVLANFRLDEGNIEVMVQGEPVDTGEDKFGAVIGNNSKIGVNASIMPGRRIGPNSFVGPHVYLTQDLEPDKTILCVPTYQVMENITGPDEAKRQELIRRLRCAG